MSAAATHSYNAVEIHEYVTMRVSGQLFGIAVQAVQDVLRSQKITRIPQAPKEIAGSLNLRGRIVTAIYLRARLGLTPLEPGTKTMSVVVEHKGEFFSLIVDSVGDVLSLEREHFESNPTNLNPKWRDVSAGLYRLKGELLVIIDIQNLLKF